MKVSIHFPIGIGWPAALRGQLNQRNAGVGPVGREVLRFQILATQGAPTA
jgi:hypothetical protein